MSQLNIVFLGTFPYPKGMAGTKLVRAVIHGIRGSEGVSVRMVILRQSSRQNPLAGTHDGVPYETVIGDMERMRAMLLAPRCS